jgi:hypothetical protein
MKITWKLKLVSLWNLTSGILKRKLTMKTKQTNSQATEISELQQRISELLEQGDTKDQKLADLLKATKVRYSMPLISYS